MRVFIIRVVFTVVNSKEDLLKLHNEENIHIARFHISLKDILFLLKNNPRLKRIEFPKMLLTRMKQEDRYPSSQILLLLAVRNIEVIEWNLSSQYKILNE